MQVVDLPSHFSQVQLAGLKTLVDHHVEDGHPVQFNAGELERIDGAAVQFLLAISKLQSKSDEGTAIVVNTNEVLINALNDMGVMDLIKCESGETKAQEAQAPDE